MTRPRAQHMMTLLRDGRVLICGGEDQTSAALRTAEVFDPKTRVITEVASMHEARSFAAAVLLPDGRVLVVGGKSAADTAEIYDPSTNVWRYTALPELQHPRPTATLMFDGVVLVRDSRAETYDPTTGRWAELLGGPPPLVREGHSATLLPSGDILFYGGGDSSTARSNIADVYSPDTFLVTARWTSFEVSENPDSHVATLLPSGRVMMTGVESKAGQGASLKVKIFVAPEGSGSFYDVERIPRGTIDIAMKASPTGRVVAVSGGISYEFDPQTLRWTTLPMVFGCNFGLSMTLLPDGRILFPLSRSGNPNCPPTLYDSAVQRWSTLPQLPNPRRDPTSTLLADGRVLITGGIRVPDPIPGSPASYVAPADVLDANTGTWSTTGRLVTPRYTHTATLLKDGRVLIAGGLPAEAGALCEIYDPVTGVFTAMSPMNVDRSSHSSVVLPDGDVLVFGGVADDTSAAQFVERFDVTTETWTPEPAPLLDRTDASVVALLDGRVLLIGGGRDIASQQSAEIFDPATRSWALAVSGFAAVVGATATVMPDGRVLVVEGFDGPHFVIDPFPADAENRPILDRPRDGSEITFAYGTTTTISAQRLVGLSEGSSGGQRSSSTALPVFSLYSLQSGKRFSLVPEHIPTVASAVDVTFSNLPEGLDVGQYLLSASASGVQSNSIPVRVACSVGIETQPRLRRVKIGAGATFSVVAIGARTFQWQKDADGTGAWTDIDGATGAAYTTPPVAAVDSGSRYRVVVRGNCTTMTSDAAILVVDDSQDPVATIVSPAGGEYWVLSTAGAPVMRLITWSMTDNVRVCHVVVSLLYSNDSGSTYVPAPAENGLPKSFGPGGLCAHPGVTTTSVAYNVPAAFPSGRSGSLYKIRVVVTDHVGNTTTADSPAAFHVVQANADSVRTIVVTNMGRMVARGGITADQASLITSKLHELASHPRVQGLVADLGSVASISSLYGSWDASPGDADRANAVLFAPGGIHDYLRTNVLSAYSGARYVVLVGDDRIIPMARIEDHTALLPESRYPAGGDLSPADTTVGQALAAGKYLSDDPLGALDAIDPDALDGNLFLPDVAIGRLVETPAQIVRAITTYIAQDGVLDLAAINPAGNKVLVTGYDFLTNVAIQERALWNRALGVKDLGATAPVDGTLIGAGWGLGSIDARAAALRGKLSGNGGTRFGVMALSGHATHYEEGVPGADPFDIQGLPAVQIHGPDSCGTPSAGPVDLSGGVVYAIGCHGGLSVPGSCQNDANHSLDLPETMLARGAVAYVANSGYGWGLRHGIGYGARLSQIFTEEMIASGTIVVGDAVRRSKTRYFLEAPRYDAYDEKTVMQWTLYGLPMYAVKTGIAANVATASAMSESRVARRLVTAAMPSSLTQLNLTFDFTGDVYEKHDSAGNVLDKQKRGCPDVKGCYYTLNGLVDRGTGSADLPIQPYAVYDSRLSGTSQHGVLWKGGTYDQENEWVPILAELISNGGDASNHGSAPRNVIIKPTSARIPLGADSPVCRASDAELNSITVTAGEAVKEQTTDPVYSIMRRYRTFDVEVLYFNNRTKPEDNCDRRGPQLGDGPFEGRYHRLDGELLSWAVPATDAADVWRVLVVYNDNAVDAHGQGAWVPLDLDDDGKGTFRGSVDVRRGTRVTYVIQAVDRRGNVTWLDYVSAQMPSSGVAHGVPQPIDVQVASRRRAVVSP